jgi:NAD+ kinase
LATLPEQIPVRPAAGRPVPLRRLVVYGNPEKPGLEPILKELAEWTKARGITLAVARELVRGSESDGRSALGELYDLDNPAERPFAVGEPAMLLSLGGDGTMLHAIHRFWPLEAPVMGVNLGSLGFNAAVLPGRMTMLIDRWLEGKATLDERLLLKVRRAQGGRPLAESVAVNDVVLAKQVEAHVIHLTLSQGGEVISSYSGDGLIVSTPTGSTAYNLSAGGPIVHPSLRVVIATAICPHTLAARPVVLAPEPAIEVGFVPRHDSDRVMLWIDGQEPWAVRRGDRVTIEAAEAPLRLVRGEGHQYFNQLRQKLLWNVENKPAEPAVEGLESPI